MFEREEEYRARVYDLAGVPLEGTSKNGHGPDRPAQKWPALGEDAYYGLAGDIVKTIEPHSEADPVAILTTLLSAVGNMIGRGTYFKVGADRHHLKIFASLIGETSKGRKGMSWNYCRDLLKVLDEGYIDDRVVNGLSSGEGLIYAVRDEVMGTDKDGDPVTVDAGVKDKRLLVMEGEFANVLKMCQREGNILSIIIRSAWDDGKLQTLTKVVLRYRYYCEDCGADSGVAFQVARQALKAFEDDVRSKKRTEAKATATERVHPEMKAKGLA